MICVLPPKVGYRSVVSQRSSRLPYIHQESEPPEEYKNEAVGLYWKADQTAGETKFGWGKAT
jgi:hypothetical protein